MHDAQSRDRKDNAGSDVAGHRSPIHRGDEQVLAREESVWQVHWRIRPGDNTT